MTFNLVRIGWPNIAAILVLAIMPAITLTTTHDRGPAAVRFEQVEPATNCQTADCSVTIAAISPEAIFE